MSVTVRILLIGLVFSVCLWPAWAQEMSPAHPTAVPTGPPVVILPAPLKMPECDLVIQSADGAPIPGAWIHWPEGSLVSDLEGKTRIPAGLSSATTFRVGRPGYGPWRGSREDLPNPLVLSDLRVMGLYLSPYGLAHKGLREHALAVLREGKMNTLVIDYKGDYGYTTPKTKVALGVEVGADKRSTIRDLSALLEDLHQQGIYLVARIVTFKDNVLANNKPDYAIKTKQGKLYVDNEDLGWVDPFCQEAWQYNIALAEEAVAMGFDEIQFDYVRFPVPQTDLVFSKPSEKEARIEAITGFLKAAKSRINLLGVPVSADIFGYVAWNKGDLQIGQEMESLFGAADRLCLMVYPSGYHQGIPGLEGSTVNSPEKTVKWTLDRAAARKAAIGTGALLVGWLQNFKDYTALKKVYGAQEIAAQIRGVAQYDGWFLWDPANKYADTLDGITLSEVQ